LFIPKNRGAEQRTPISVIPCKTTCWHGGPC